MTVGLRLSGAGLQFLLQVTLGNLLGAAGLGIFLLYASWMRLLETVFGLGFRQYALRTLAPMPLEEFHRRHWSLLAGALSRVAALGLFVLLAAVGAVLIWRSVAGEPMEYGWVLLLAIVAAIAMAGIRIVADALKARSRANRGLVLEFSLEPALLLLAVPAVWLVLRLTIRAVVWCHVAILYGILIAALAMWAVTVKQPMSRRTSNTNSAWRASRAEPAPWRTILTFWAFNVLSVLLWTLPYLILPVFATEQDIGLFGVAQRLVALATMILVGLGAMFAPHFARAYVQRDARQLRQSLLRSQAYSFAAYLPLLLAFFLTPGLILGLFGPEFVDARPLLWVMAAGQTMNAATGLSSEFLNMAGAERIELRVTAGALASMSLLAVVLGAWYGVMGIAVAYAVTLAGKKIVSYLCCLLHLRKIGSNVLPC